MAIRTNNFYFNCGILAALGFIYAADQENIAEEIVAASEPYALLRIARDNEDCYLSNLRRTIRTVAEQRRSKK